MIIRLQRYKIEEKRNMAGTILSVRYEYLIAIWKWKWKRFRFRKYYLRFLSKNDLLNDWFYSYKDGKQVSVQLTRSKSDATKFYDDANSLTYRNKSLAENIINEIKKNPDRFILE